MATMTFPDPRMRRLSYLLLALASAGMVGESYPVKAQIIPPSAEPGREEQSPQFPELPQAPSAVPTAKPPELDPQMAAITFTLKSISVDGVTAFEPETIERIYAPFINQNITIGQLYEITTRMQQLYLDAGYTLAKVYLPEQSLAQGHVQVAVIEGYVGQVDIDPTFLKSPILTAFSSEVLAMHPLNTLELERIMLLLNDAPGLKASAILSGLEPAANAAPGAIKLTLQNSETGDDPLTTVSLDNTGSLYTGPFQMGVTTELQHLGVNYSSLDLHAQATTTLSEIRQLGIDYTVPVFGLSGTKLLFSASSTNTKPGENLADLDVKGRTSSLSCQISYPLIRQRAETWLINAGFEYKNVETNVLNSRLFSDTLRTVSLDTRYSLTDSFNGLNFFYLKFTQGLDLFGNRPSGSADLSRQDGRTDFHKIEASYSRQQLLGNGFDLLARVQGQYAWSPLLSSEEFGFGGSTIGRGYDSGELSGDHGLAASLELRYTTPLDIGSVSLQPYAFYDIGKVWNIDPSDRNMTSAASAGIGVRLYGRRGWDLDTTLALPLTKPVDNPQHYTTAKGARLTLSLRIKF